MAKDDLSSLLNLVETAGINEITSLLNQATEKLSDGKYTLREYKVVLINVAKKADKLAKEIYAKKNSDPNFNKVDIEEYRTLLDIARDCREGLREVILFRGHSHKV